MSVTSVDSGGPPLVVALLSDLIFATKIEATARLIDIALATYRSRESFTQAAALARGAIFDLKDAVHDALEVGQALKRVHPRLRIAAFGPHVEAQRLRDARAAGFDLVLPRSVFAETLPDLLKSLGAPLEEEKRA